MKFIKDFLIVEMSAFGDNPDKDPIIQLSSIVLDKNNLLEKGIFNTYIKTSLLEGTLKKHAEELGVGVDVLKTSPKYLEAIKKFTEFIESHSAILTIQNQKSLFFLKSFFTKGGFPFPFEGPSMSLWSLEYLYSVRLGLNKIPTLDTLTNYFGIKIKNPGNSLEKARIEAEVLRKITQK